MTMRESIVCYISSCLRISRSDCFWHSRAYRKSQVISISAYAVNDLYDAKASKPKIEILSPCAISPEYHTPTFCALLTLSCASDQQSTKSSSSSLQLQSRPKFPSRIIPNKGKAARPTTLTRSRGKQTR